MKSGLNARWIKELLKETFQEWKKDDVGRWAAALAYFTAVSVAPLIVLLLGLVAAIWGEEAASGQLQGYLTGAMGKANAALFEEIIANAKRPVVGSVAGILSILVLIWGASNVFAQLQAALNIIWDAPPPKKISFLRTIQKRLLSFTMVLTLGFLLLVSLALSTALSAVGEYVFGGGESGLLLRLCNGGLALIVTSVLIASIYKVLPDVKIGWRHVIFGAVLTAALFTLGKLALGWYLGRASTSSAYGAAGSLVVFLLWVQYSAQIFFFGAEFTQVYARRFAPTRLTKTNGSKPQPAT